MNIVSYLSLKKLFFSLRLMKIANIGNENNCLLLPYKLARKVDGIKPYLVFYIFSEVTGKLQRIRKDPPANEKKTIWFKERIKKANEMLINGYRIVSSGDLKDIENAPQNYTILEALEKITQIRIQNNITSVSTLPRQKSYRNIFEAYLTKKKLNTLNVSQIQKTHIIYFIDGIVGKATTKNTYLSYVKAIFASFLEKEWINEDPALKIKKLKETESESVAFLPEDISPLKELIMLHSTELYVFCMFVFYCFVRPIELRRLLVKNVNIKDRKISISGTNSKNKKTLTVMIPKQLAKILDNTDFLKDRKPNEPLFADKNDKNYSKNQYSVAFTEILKNNDYPKEYSLYCWKHTGVTETYKLTKDIKYIQQQCRHQSIEETSKYLKGLGLHELNPNVDNAPEI